VSSAVIEAQEPQRRGGVRTWLRRILLVIAALLVAVYALALLVTVASDGWVRHSVTIDAPVEAVWEYGSDSTRARDWSVYFHHITPKSGPGIAPDGTVGAYRVCYRNADEQGIRWDETTEKIRPLEHREIRTFNLVGFPLGPIGRAQEYAVYQDYERIDADRSRLTFRSKLVRPEGFGRLLSWPLVKGSYVVFGAPAGQEVFVWNLENIAAAVEAEHDGRPYDRPHPYDDNLPWEQTPLRWWFGNRWDALTA
jgi:hypothetical protein